MNLGLAPLPLRAKRGRRALSLQLRVCLVREGKLHTSIKIFGRHHLSGAIAGSARHNTLRVVAQGTELRGGYTIYGAEQAVYEVALLRPE